MVRLSLKGYLVMLGIYTNLGVLLDSVQTCQWHYEYKGNNKHLYTDMYKYFFSNFCLVDNIYAHIGYD